LSNIADFIDIGKKNEKFHIFFMEFLKSLPLLAQTKTKKPVFMKKKNWIISAFVVMGTVIFTSCAAGNHLCDAYGSIDVTPVKSATEKTIASPSLTTADIQKVEPKS
jgi:hypothetical protein